MQPTISSSAIDNFVRLSEATKSDMRELTILEETTASDTGQSHAIIR